MVTFDEAKAARLEVARAVPTELWGLAADLLEEMKAFDEGVESKAIRYVKTPSGARNYGEPIGSPIKPNAPKLSYVRNGPKKRRVGVPATASGSNVVDPGSTGFKPVKELSVSERATEKTRLRGLIENNDPKKTGQFRERLRDIQRHENELDATIKNPGRDISHLSDEAKPKPATKPVAKPEPSKPAPTQTFGTSSEVDKEIATLTKVPVRSSAQQTRLDALKAEQKKRNAAPGPSSSGALSREERAATSQVFEGGVNPVEVDPKRLTDANLRFQISGLAKKKKLTKKDGARAQALLAEFNRRNAEDQRSQARGLVGAKSDELVFGIDRLANSVKALDVVGDGDWDCEHMSDGDVDYFLLKSLTGRPTVEKLQKANALMSERASRVAADTEVKELTWEFTE
jgi:hypothetical protein